jgi:hypothetical protein
MTSADIVSRVLRHRTLTERRLTRLLKQISSAATLEDIKAIIFDEDQEIPFIVYVMQLSELFGDDADADALIPTIQDAWNYFPHRRLGGSCPAELMLQRIPGLTPADLRA